MTSMETPRLLSEYVAARAQSERSISANVVVASASATRNADAEIPGSARVSRAGERVLAIANFPCGFASRIANGQRKVRFGETRALPGRRRGATCWLRSGRRNREIPLPQFFDVWQFLEIAQPKVIEEELRRFIEKRAPGDFCASSDFHQAALHQCLQYAVDVHAAHRFHIGACNGLPICDDRQSFQRRRTQPRRLRRGEKLADPLRVLRIGRKLPAFGFF